MSGPTDHGVAAIDAPAGDMIVTVRVMAALGDGGTEHLELPGPESPTVAAVLEVLVARRPRLAERLRTPQGELQRFVNVFIGANNIKQLGGLGARVPLGAEVWVIPPGSGG